MTPTKAPEAPARRARQTATPVVNDDPTDDVDATSTVEFGPWLAQGAELRVSKWRAGRGFYAPAHRGAPTSTRQAEVLNTAAIAAPTDEEGVVIGEDRLSRTLVAGDPFTAYQKGLISSPNVVVVGDVGAGKSSLTKTVCVLRVLPLRRRRVVVFDKKDQGGRGEYTSLVERNGSTPIFFSLDGSEKRSIINLLDPAIVLGAGLGRTLDLLRAVAETVAGRGLDDWEMEALRRALRMTMTWGESAGRAPTLVDLAAQLPRVHTTRDELSPAARERLHQSAATVMFVLSGLLEEFSGLFDGETSKAIDLSDRLTSFDISQLPATGPAAPMVVAAANMWLMGVLRRRRGWFTNVLAEEGWDLIGGANGALWRSLIKLARGLGVSMITNIHKLADIPKSSPAYAIIQEAQTVHVFRQSRAEDQAASIEAFNLESSAGGSLGSLTTGDHLYKVGSNAEVRVRHVRTPWEIAVTNTDEAMTENGRGQA
ncbi:ATP/GTP-binding protein [Cellulomonas sp. HD19AZ1]|uniref:ATP/GTP-binding protein n=1 Tax=Cellulomonas sp. HD19AZ1 TaxID=2559593 RepID=UPI00107080EB|nr:ATP/GTP-binding protein [Cellulomonas sp. HD19AZ1]TFH68159.1 ATP/GTP-binding protein [Cellulomonas sp. HD19AZ1]